MDYKAMTTTPAILVPAGAQSIARETTGGIRGELVRKALHMLIALVPSIATVAGVVPALGILSLGVLAYSGAEYARLQGRSVLLISALTMLASRPRDRGRFVAGPVTLGVGAMLALLLYPAPAAFLAIYALAFGDGVASLVGRAFGRTTILPGTTVEGSLACFVAVFAAALTVTGAARPALIIATVATVLEAIPTDDMDNIILPVGVGLVTTMLLNL
ncbi:MAG: diacylglycerol/polyprenol kinase family protein [Spirochaetota bacterium]